MALASASVRLRMSRCGYDMALMPYFVPLSSPCPIVPLVQLPRSLRSLVNLPSCPIRRSKARSKSTLSMGGSVKLLLSEPLSLGLQTPALGVELLLSDELGSGAGDDGSEGKVLEV